MLDDDMVCDFFLFFAIFLPFVCILCPIDLRDPSEFITATIAIGHLERQVMVKLDGWCL
jgi:hypothetical protein